MISERQASRTHAACQPSSPTRKAIGVGRTNAAVLDPIVAAATARPRYLRNHRGTTAWVNSMACPPDMKPVTTPTSNQNCHTSVTRLVRARQLAMTRPVRKTVRRAPPGVSANRVRTKAPSAPIRMRRKSPAKTSVIVQSRASLMGLAMTPRDQLMPLDTNIMEKPMATIT